MTDYSKMSDFDISKRVLIALGYKPAYEDESCISFLSSDGRKDVGYGGVKRFKFDPCNNPADAWPIIVEHGIGFYRIDDAEDTAKDMIGEWHATGPVDWAYGERDSPFDSRHKNPLRAAMIIFLMMKDAEK